MASSPTTVVLTDGRKFLIDVANSKPSDIVAVEEHFDISSDDLGGPKARTAWTLYTIWRMCGRSDESIKSVPFEEFIELVDDIVREDEPEDPTESAPTT